MMREKPPGSSSFPSASLASRTSGTSLEISLHRHGRSMPQAFTDPHWPLYRLNGWQYRIGPSRRDPKGGIDAPQRKDRNRNGGSLGHGARRGSQVREGGRAGRG